MATVIKDDGEKIENAANWQATEDDWKPLVASFIIYWTPKCLYLLFMLAPGIMGFKPGLWQGHTRTVRDIPALSRWKVNITPGSGQVHNGGGFLTPKDLPVLGCIHPPLCLTCDQPLCPLPPTWCCHHHPHAGTGISQLEFETIYEAFLCLMNCCWHGWSSSMFFSKFPLGRLLSLAGHTWLGRALVVKTDSMPELLGPLLNIQSFRNSLLWSVNTFTIHFTVNYIT